MNLNELVSNGSYWFEPVQIGLHLFKLVQIGLNCSKLTKFYSSFQNLAMEWFGHAAAQGHAHSSYNLAIGHLKGFKTKLDPGEAHEHIKYAADQGFHLAKDVLLHVCKHGGCTD